MNSILKHTLRSVFKNKIQACVIVFTIVLVTALMFSAFSLSDVFYAMNSAEQKRFAADTDMLLGSATQYGETFEKAIVEELIEDGDVVYADYFFRVNSIMRTPKVSKSVFLESTDLDAYLNRHPLNFISKYESGSVLKHQTAIVGETFAKNNGLKAGDEIKVYLSYLKQYTELTIKYVAKDEGIFASALAVNILTDFSAVYGDAFVNSVYIKFSDPSLFSKYEEIFNKHFPKISVANAGINEKAQQIAKNSTMLLSVAVIFIAATMMLILLTSYLIIARHRMSDMIIFKASGATPKQVALILLLEVLVYAIFGALIGLGIGRLLMHFAVRSLLPVGGFVIQYQFWKYLFSFVISVFVCIAACLAPAVIASRKTIRELNSSPQKIAKKGNPVIAAVSLVFIIINLIALNFLNGIYIVIFIIFFIAAAAFFISSAVPLIIRFTSFVFSKIVHTGSLFLSTKSAKRNKGVHSVSVLLIVAIVFSFVVFEVINIVKLTTKPYLTRYVADFVAVSEGNKDAAVQKLINDDFLKIDGVTGAGYFCQSAFEIPDNAENSFGLQGVNSEWTLLHCSKDGLSDGTVERWNSTENPVVLTNEMMVRYNLKIGDTVSYKSLHNEYKGEMLEFKIVGIDYTVTEWDFVGYVKFSAVEKMSYSSVYLITVSNNKSINKNELFLKIRDIAENMYSAENIKIDGIYVLEFVEWAYAGNFNLAGLSSLLGFLQIFLFIVSFLGIINISIVTVYDRRHEFILYKLNGMSSKSYLKFALGEGLLITVISALTGLVLCIMSNMILPSVASIINKFLRFGFFPSASLIILAATSAIFISTWLIIAFFNRKRNILQINERFNC